MLDRMTRGDKVAAGGAILLIVSLFLAWYKIDLSGSELAGTAVQTALDRVGGITAWKALEILDVVFLLVGLGVLAAVALVANGQLDESFRRPIESVGTVTALAVVFRMVDQPGNASFITLQFGIYLALVGAVAIAVGGMLNRQDGM